MSFLDTFKAVTALLPLVRELVAQAETLFPEGGVGQQKLALVREWLDKAAQAQAIATPAFEAAWPFLNAAITTAVTIAKLLKK